MPWKVETLMSERMEFVLRLEKGERMSDLCREYGISRKTGYKFKERYALFGPGGLHDQHRAPLRQWRKTAEEIEASILACKKQFPSWGAKAFRCHPNLST